MILYVAKRGENNIGAKQHLRALKELYGEERIYVVDLLNPIKEVKERYISFGYNRYSVVRILRWLQGNVGFIGRKEINEIIRIIKDNNISIVFMEESDLGNLVSAIKQYNVNIRIICFYHDISADLFLQRKRRAPAWRIHEKIECAITIRQEKVSTDKVDECWVFNEADSVRLLKYYGIQPNAIVPLSGDIISEIKAKRSEAEDEKNILFVCSTYAVNERGFLWFYKNVYPYVKGNYCFTVVGSGTQKLNQVIKEKNIKILGKVEDLKDYYESTDIVIIPVFEGGGMKVKTLEALSYGKCIVSTTECLNGYWEFFQDNIKNIDVFKCDNADEWIDVLNMLYDRKIERVNANILQCFRENFSYQEMKKHFKMQLEKSGLL